MRSVFVVVLGVAPTQVGELLSAHFQHRGTDWILDGVNGPVMYISLITPGSEYPDESQFLQPFRLDNPVLVVADVSGRYPGDTEVRAFVDLMLRQMRGFAFDDYTDHPWSLDELRANHHEQRHPFFDYRGWYDEEKSTGQG